MFANLYSGSMEITGACSRLLAELMRAIKCSSPSSATELHVVQNDHIVHCKAPNPRKLDDATVRALVTVFGMENNGRIKKENARKVVEKLGLLYGAEEEKKGSHFELPCQGGLDSDEVPVEEVLQELEEDVSKRKELLHEAFNIFDEDGNGFIEAVELKRVLECLGLDRGWGMNEIEKMVEVADLNLDGKVDFGEFELMMK